MPPWITLTARRSGVATLGAWKRETVAVYSSGA